MVNMTYYKYLNQANFLIRLRKESSKFQQDIYPFALQNALVRTLSWLLDIRLAVFMFVGHRNALCNIFK